MVFKPHRQRNQPLDSLQLPYSHTFDFETLAFKEERERPLINPAFHPAFKSGLDFRPYFTFIEEIVEKMIPKEILNDLKNSSSPEAIEAAIARLNTLLPLLTWGEGLDIAHKVCISLICPADFTHGVGRYLTDAVCRWLVPGKFLPVHSTQSLNFQFSGYDKQNYFVHQVLVEAADRTELALIRNHLPDVAHDIRLNIIAVKHARNVVSNKKLTTNQKKTLIQENISSLIDRPFKEFDNNVFDQMHHFLIKLTAEEKLAELRDKFASFLDQKQRSFDRDIFNEIQHFILLFRDRFTGIRDLRHISRVISFQFLFRKTLQRDIMSAPQERHLSFKLLPSELHLPTGNRPILGILVGINLLRENELFDERHLLAAIKHCMPSLRKVPDSSICDRRPQDNVLLFYVEMEKEENQAITLDEMKLLRKRLPREIKGHFENVIHPVFMPRNEEEVMRNIVILSHQLRYVHDIPQVVISFEAQTDHELSFTVILLRLLRPDTVPLRDELQSSYTFLKFSDHEVKHVGWLRKKYLKEANIFRINLGKKPFLRKDYSLDLFKARQAIASELTRLLGDIRDFNGGILSKQHELLHKLKELVAESGHANDFLLENFFYSLTPALMQSILSAALLKELFLMLLEALDYDYDTAPFFFKAQPSGEYFLFMVGSRDPAFKERVAAAINELKIPTSALTHTSVDAYEVATLGYLFRSNDPAQRKALEAAVQSALVKH